ncbi:MAG: dihydroxy-acid dehydratase, partial [Pseudomonadota bacterium]
VNMIHAAGGLGFVIGQLLDAGLLHNDTTTVVGKGLGDYAVEATLAGQNLQWQASPKTSPDDTIIRDHKTPFQPQGGVTFLRGNLGMAVAKISAVAPDRQTVRAKARVFDDQASVRTAFDAGALDCDHICVVRFQGPRANGMPELHGLMPILGVLLGRGFKVALITDGRLSGASGKVPAAIHLSPEAIDGSALAKLRDGDMLNFDATRGVLDHEVNETVWQARAPVSCPQNHQSLGIGTELFSIARTHVSDAAHGASFLQGSSYE